MLYAAYSLTIEEIRVQVPNVRADKGVTGDEATEDGFAVFAGMPAGRAGAFDSRDALEPE